MTTLKKSWAKKCRDAMWQLYSGNDEVDSGMADGLCNCFYSNDWMDIIPAIKQTIGVNNMSAYWWKYACGRCDHMISPIGAAEAYTARIIALELFALICEEEGE